MPCIPGGFDPEALEGPLAPLDSLPRALWLPGIVHSIGRLPRRLEGIARLREALLAGGLPPPRSWPWPEGKVRSMFADVTKELELPRYCQGRDEVADQVVKSLLWHTDRIVDYRNEWDEDKAADQALRAFREDWKQRAGEIDQLSWVFGDLGEALKHDRWDVTRGLLRSAGWREILRIRALLERLPEIARVIRRLGRARQTEQSDPASHAVVPVLEEAATLSPVTRSVRVPDMPAETRGIRRSGQIGRMLAAEAMLLAHPRLRRVWFARHAERILMTYRDQDVMSETALARTPSWRPVPRREPQRRLEMGPIMVCVDTSGSMRGAAEDVAKACVLEAMRAAHAQNRPCHAFAFGGPGEIVERELRVDARGIEDLVDFLTQSFHGGTEVSEPLDRAARRAAQEAWRFADLLIATDGEFGATAATVRRIDDAKRELGLRIQGMLIGDRETIGMLEVCDQIHWVRDWRRFGPGGECPIHSKSLTAEYFPGALRAAGRPDDVPADVASRAVSGRPIGSAK